MEEKRWKELRAIIRRLARRKSSREAFREARSPSVYR